MTEKVHDQSAVKAWFPREAADIEKRLQIAAGVFFVSLVAFKSFGQIFYLYAVLQGAGFALMFAAAATVFRIFFSNAEPGPKGRAILRLIWIAAVLGSLTMLVAGGWVLLQVGRVAVP
jgi:hypothetical protein